MLCSQLFSGFARNMLAIVVGYQIYELTHDALALGWLGLAEAIPALGLALIGGYYADRMDRRKVILVTTAFSVVALALLAIASLSKDLTVTLVGIYAITFVLGISSGFQRPAMSAFDAQITPMSVAVNANSWTSSSWQVASIAGPAVGGFAYALIGVTNTYWLMTALMVLTFACISLIAPKPIPVPPEGESIRQSVAAGVHFVLRSQVLLGSMALDLFAVLFGGAMAMLPVFAADILNVGPQGLGLLRAAPSVGALGVMLVSTRITPRRNAGRILVMAVFGFGISMIVFALSTNFWISFAALALSGLLDGISMVVRFAITRIMSPERMRGRIAAVSWIFIGASNEIGAFESGVAARLLGTISSVFWGGVVTLIVVAATFVLAPKLRALDLDHEAEKAGTQRLGDT